MNPKKSSSGEAQKSAKSIQKKIKIKHAKSDITSSVQPRLYVLSYGMNQMLNEVSNTHIPSVFLPDDFKSYIKVSVECHNVIRPGAPNNFKVKNYMPLVFKALRIKFNISENMIKDCFQAGFKLSKKNSNIYKSRDKQIYIKFFDNDEITDFANLIPQYYNHIVINNCQTFLPIYLALCRVFVDGKYSYGVVIKNTVNSLKYETHIKQNFQFSNKESEKEGFGSDTSNMNIRVSDEITKIIKNRLSKDIDFLGNNQVNKISIITKLLKLREKSDCDSIHHVECTLSNDHLNDLPEQNEMFSCNDDTYKLYISIMDYSQSLSSPVRKASTMTSPHKDVSEENAKPSKLSIHKDKLFHIYFKKTFAQ